VTFTMTLGDIWWELLLAARHWLLVGTKKTQRTRQTLSLEDQDVPVTTAVDRPTSLKQKWQICRRVIARSFKCLRRTPSKGSTR
jgi:hypothetical protein